MTQEQRNELESMLTKARADEAALIEVHDRMLANAGTIEGLRAEATEIVLKLEQLLAEGGAE
jgi:dephospho-CoA kinase